MNEKKQPHVYFGMEHFAKIIAYRKYDNGDVDFATDYFKYRLRQGKFEVWSFGKATFVSAPGVTRIELLENVDIYNEEELK